MKMETKPNEIYLCLGSNLGERKENLSKALDLLSQRLRVSEVSSTYETEAVGSTAQPRFLNMVVKAYSMLEPTGLLLLVKGIERKLGRIPGPRNAPRTIDIDILFYGDQVVNTPELVIPHPRLTERAFVLVPLNEIAPTYIHPVNKKSVGVMLKELKQGLQGVFKLKED
jgi:2-amino-4-hydroxy-6-hydroxymethyldihydropteridine diphosphokinase